LDRRLGGLQSRSGRGGEEKKCPAAAGTRTPSHVLGYQRFSGKCCLYLHNPRPHNPEDLYLKPEIPYSV